jgi:hypothetical protein
LENVEDAQQFLTELTRVFPTPEDRDNWFIKPNKNIGDVTPFDMIFGFHFYGAGEGLLLLQFPRE